MTTTTDNKKTQKQESAEKLAEQASENVRLAKAIMERMTRRKRTVAEPQAQVMYEQKFK